MTTTAKPGILQRQQKQIDELQDQLNQLRAERDRLKIENHGYRNVIA